MDIAAKSALTWEAAVGDPTTHPIPEGRIVDGCDLDEAEAEQEPRTAAPQFPQWMLADLQLMGTCRDDDTRHTDCIFLLNRNAGQNTNKQEQKHVPAQLYDLDGGGILSYGRLDACGLC